MASYKPIKETLRAGIWQELEVFCVELDNNEPRPDQKENVSSFISYKLISVINKRGIEQNDGEVLTYKTMPELVFSFNCYSKDKDEALTLARDLHSWFMFIGYNYLKDNGVVVALLENTQDRSEFLETSYDNRVGFDVRLRIGQELETEIEIIESVEINNKVLGE